jgi:photosystem II stability/assembly factor-like uncharacterized protein
MNKILFSLFFVICGECYCQSQWEIETNFYGSIIFQNVSAVDSQTCWIAGYYLGTDSPFVARRSFITGWRKLSINDIRGFVPVCIAAKDTNSAWFGTTDGKVFHTSNSGINWILQIDAGGSSFTNSIKFSKNQPTYGYVCCDPPNGGGTPFKIYKTTDSGLNWHELSVSLGGNYVGYQNCMSVTDSSHVWFGLWNLSSNSAKVAYTSNSGSNWQVYSLPGDGYYTTAVEFNSTNLLGFSSTNASAKYLLKSSNGGINWSNLLPLSNYWDLEALIWIYGSSTWYFATLESIYKSSNDGLNWVNMNAPLGSSVINYIDAVKSGVKVYGWAIRSDGTVLKMLDTLSSIGVVKIGSEIPKAFSLGQNFPNPFNPRTEINFDLACSEHFRFVVFDVTGKVVYTLSSYKTPGRYKIYFDGSDLSSSVYFYRIEAVNFTQTKRMVLIK